MTDLVKEENDVMEALYEMLGDFKYFIAFTDKEELVIGIDDTKEMVKVLKEKMAILKAANLLPDNVVALRPKKQ